MSSKSSILSQLNCYKDQLQEDLKKLEQKIFDLETSYLEETGAYGKLFFINDKNAFPQNYFSLFFFNISNFPKN